jgi:hypothetical protein
MFVSQCDRPSCTPIQTTCKIIVLYIFICPETQRRREEFLTSKRPHINEEIALRKTLTGTKDNELRNLGALAYKITCKWEDRVKKVLLRFGRGEELDCT